MRRMRKGLALLLAIMLVVPAMPSAAAEISQGTVVDSVGSSMEKEAAGENTDTVKEPVKEGDTGTAKEPVKEGDTGTAKEPIKEENAEAAKEPAKEESPETEKKQEKEDILQQDDISGNEGNVSEDDAAAEDSISEGTVAEVYFNTGNYSFGVVSPENYKEGDCDENGVGYECFQEDGSYTIDITALTGKINPFFPYEVQFTYNGETTEEWFMTPDDSITIGGHLFYVSADFDGTAVTQMSMNVAGDTVIVYPEKKEFTNNGGIAMFSLQPLNQDEYLDADLSAYTPVELTMVSVKALLGNKIAENDKVVWKKAYDNGDDYVISQSGDSIDLSYNTCSSYSSSSSSSWEMIVGDADQLNGNNKRYYVNVAMTSSQNWLTLGAYTQDASGNRKEINIVQNEYYDYDRENRNVRAYLSASDLGDARSAYIGLQLNKTDFSNSRISSVAIYEGQYASAADAADGENITNKLWEPVLTNKDAGYCVEQYDERLVTMVAYDKSNNVIGCMPFSLYYYPSRNSINTYSLYMQTSSDKEYNVVSNTNHKTGEDGCIILTSTLYAGYPANGTYYQKFDYSKDSKIQNNLVTAAYAGNYTTIASATAASATDIKDKLFGDGYGADYSKGVYFSIFVGADGTDSQEVYHYCVKTVEGNEEKSDIDILSGDTAVQFTGLKDASGNKVDAYIVDVREDSYAEFNYRTIMVGGDVDIRSLKPEFILANGIRLYAADGTEQKSGENAHDFAANPVLQYTASSENKEEQKNYWLQVVKAENGSGKIYINSLKDPEAKTKTDGNPISSIREVALDSYHDNIHDILIANMGTDAISDLNVELSSDSTVELDSYWTLSGNQDLPGYDEAKIIKDYSYSGNVIRYSQNLAKIRLRAKAGATTVSGTLTIKSGSSELVKLQLTGTIGDPVITTKSIPQAVKFVPYGTMIQNNNKYSYNKMIYYFDSGRLPAGMEVKRNGEIYGVPTTTGTYTFAVRMMLQRNNKELDRKEFTLTVIDNEDSNVSGATDSGYELTEQIQNFKLSESTDQTMVSQGVYGEYTDIFLDGVKLVEGTDYDSESGSTRITIRSQTLKASNVTGRHTLGIEFRTADDKILKTAAQNYYITNENSGGSGDDSGGSSGDSGSSGSGSGSSSGGSGDSGSGSGSSSGGSGSSGNGSGDSGATGSTGSVTPTDAATQALSYTIVPGDTLWKIARKFYGSGESWEMIYAANRAVLESPDKIYAGQVLTIYMAPDNSMITVPANNGNVIYYTVEAGDTLWEIAKKYYGIGRYWRRIYEANTEVLSNPGKLRVGQVIVVPSLER